MLIRPEDNLPPVIYPLVWRPVLARADKDMLLRIKCDSSKGSIYIIEADEKVALYYDPELDEIGLESVSRLERDATEGSLVRDETHVAKPIKEVLPKSGRRP